MTCFISIFLLFSVAAQAVLGDVLFCYYGAWTIYRQNAGKFTPKDIDPHLCTHIVYSFAGLDELTDQIKVLDPWGDLCEGGGKCGFKNFVGLKQQNPKLKALLAVGGWNEGSLKYSKMAASVSGRKSFINSAVKLVKEHNFDGLDMDWEFPGFRGGGLLDKANFATLLRELKQEMSKSGLLLTSAVSAGKETIDGAYDVKSIAESLDFINVMTYDFEGAWNRFTGLNAPLKCSGENCKLSVEYAINYWMQLGAPSNKIVMGIPLYGRTFRLSNAGQNAIGAPSTGPGKAGKYSGAPGSMGYNELCDELKGWTTKWDITSQTPYAYKGIEWISYSNARSVKEKVKVAKSKGLAGVMVWSIEQDDFRNKCGDGKFPLLTSIKNELNIGGGGGGQPPPERPPPPTRPDPSPTSPPSQPGECVDFSRDPNHCDVFYRCVRNPDGSITKTKFTCQTPLVFDTNLKVCNWRDHVEC